MKTKKQIEADENRKDIIENLGKAADNQNKAAKELKVKITEANEAISSTLGSNVKLSNKDKQTLASTIAQVNNLLKLAKKGKDVTKELNALRIKK